MVLYYNVYHFDTSDQREPLMNIQGNILYIALTTMPLILRHTFKGDTLDANRRVANACI